MKFWFCEKCGKRLTEADFDEGRAADKQAKGVFCQSCSVGVVTTHIEAISGPTSKSSHSGMKAVAKDSKRYIDPASATTPSLPVLPVAPSAGSNRSSRMLLIPQKPASDRKPETAKPPPPMSLVPIFAGGAVALIVTAVVLMSSSPSATPEHVSAAPAPEAPRTFAPAAADTGGHASTFNPQSGKADPEQQINDAFDALRSKLKPMSKEDQAAALDQFISANKDSIAASRARKMLADLKLPAQSGASNTTTPPAAVATAPKAPATPAPKPAPVAVNKPAPPKPGEQAKTAPPVPQISPAVAAETARLAAVAGMTAYAAFQSDLQTALRAHDAEKVKSLLAQAETNDAFASKKSDLANVKPVLDWLSELDNAVSKGAANLKDVADFTLPVAHGAPLHVGKSAEFKFVDFKDNEILVSSKGLTLTVPLISLSDNVRAQLALLGLGDTPHTKVLQAFVDALAAPDRKGDAGVLSRLAGTVPSDELACLKQLFADAEADAREHAAEAAWKDLSKLGVDYDPKKAPLIKSGIASFRAAFGETTFAAAHVAELNDFESLQWEPDAKGLLIRLKMDDLQAASVADASGQNHAGTAVNGPQVVPGKLNSALSFNGVNQSVTLPDDLFHPHPVLTVSIWFNTTDSGTILAQQEVLPNEATNTKRHHSILYLGTTGRLYAGFFRKATTTFAQDIPVNDGKWHHVAIATQKEPGTAKDRQNVYLDGVRVASLPGPIDTSGMIHSQLGAGGGQGMPGTNGKWFYFKGMLDDFRVYDRTLTESEIQHLAGKRE